MTLSTVINYGPAARGLINPAARFGGVTLPVIAYANGVYTATMFQIGASLQWQRDGVDIAGATSSTYNEQAADDNTFVRLKQTFGASVLYSSAVIQGYDSLVYSTSFAAANGTNLDGFEGFAKVGAFSSRFFINNNDVQYTAVGANQFTLKSLGSPLHEWEFTYARPAGAGFANLNASIRRAVFQRSDASNYVYLEVKSGNWRLVKVAAGVGTTLQATTNVNNPDGTTFGVKFIKVGASKYAQVYRNGARIGTGGNGYDVSDVPDGNYVGFYDDNGCNTDAEVTAFPFDVYRAARAFVYPATGITINSVSINTPDLSRGYSGPTARIQGTYTGSIANLQVGIASASNNAQIANWTGDMATDGAGSFDLDNVPIPIAALGTAPNFWLRNAADHSIGAVQAQAVGIYAAISPAKVGMNANVWSGGGSAPDIVRNRARQGNWRLYNSATGTYNLQGGDTTAVPLNALGNPTGVIPAPFTHLVLFAWENVTADAPIRRGSFSLGNIPAGMTVTWTDTSGVTGATSSGITINASGMVNAWLRFSGTPTGGWAAQGNNLDPTLYESGDTNTDRLLIDQFVSDYGSGAGFDSFRFMKLLGCEMVSGTEIPRRFATPEFVAAAMVQMGVDGYVTIPVTWVDAQVTDFAQRMAAELARLGSSLNVEVEVGNEIWGSHYGYQYRYTRWRAANEGCTPGVADALTVIDGFSMTNSSGVTNAAFTSGDVFFCRAVGDQHVVALALRDTTIGATVPASGSNADFTILATSTNVALGQKQWQGRMQARWGNIFKAAFPAGRVKSVLGVFRDDTVTAIMQRLAFESCWQSIDKYASTLYVGGQRTYNTTTYPWMGNYITNRAQFIADYAADFATQAATLITQQVTMKHGVENYFRATMGIPSTTAVPQYAVYEAGNHGSIASAPDQTEMVAAMAEMVQSAAMGGAWTTLFTDSHDKLGGTQVWFVDYEPYALLNGSVVQVFGGLYNVVGGRVNTRYYDGLTSFAQAA
jgi:hypothetical protein